MDNTGTVIEGQWTDCQDGCPGTSYTCDPFQYFQSVGRCIPMSEKQAIMARRKSKDKLDVFSYIVRWRYFALQILQFPCLYQYIVGRQNRTLPTPRHADIYGHFIAFIQYYTPDLMAFEQDILSRQFCVLRERLAFLTLVSSHQSLYRTLEDLKRIDQRFPAQHLDF